MPGFCRHLFGIRLKEQNVRHALLFHLGPITVWYLVLPWPSNDKSTASVDVRSSSLPTPPLGPVFSYVSCPLVHLFPHVQSDNFSMAFPTKRNASTVIFRVVTQCGTGGYQRFTSRSNRQYLHPHRESLVSERNTQLPVTVMLLWRPYCTQKLRTRVTVGNVHS